MHVWADVVPFLALDGYQSINDQPMTNKTPQASRRRTKCCQHGAPDFYLQLHSIPICPLAWYWQFGSELCPIKNPIIHKMLYPSKTKITVGDVFTADRSIGQGNFIA